MNIQEVKNKLALAKSENKLVKKFIKWRSIYDACVETKINDSIPEFASIGGFGSFSERISNIKMLQNENENTNRG